MFVSNQYKKDIDKNYKILTREDEIVILAAAKAGDQKAIDKLVFSQLLMVIEVVKEHNADPTVFEDLINAGITGLIKAIEPFNLSSGNRFNTYASYWVKVEVIRAIVRNGTIRIPDHLAAKLAKQKKMLRLGKTTDENGDPIDEQSVLDFSYQSMNEYREDDLALEEKLGYEDSSFAENELKQEIGIVMEYLSDSQRQVIELLFGLNGQKVHTEEEAGTVLGVTKQRVSQIKIMALKKLKSRTKKIL
jgi:RNA polymerase primary sigma factor